MTSLHRRLILAATLGAALAAASCSQMREHLPGMPGTSASAAMPPADATALWNHLQKVNYAASYKLFPGKGRMYPGSQPHGAFLTTYVNDAAFDALRGGSARLPAGSILVKENYMPDRSLAAVTVMYKVAGFDASNNDWYWLKRSADGTVEASGKPAGCIACHKPAARDYVLTPMGG